MQTAQSKHGPGNRVVRLGAVAAMVGGGAWVLKGGAILTTGEQPPVAFELAPPLFALGLLGLYAALGGVDPRAKVGAAAATLAIALMLGAGIARAVDPALTPESEEFAPLSAVQLAAALCLLAALVLLGLAGRRAGHGGSAALSLWMGLLFIPALLVGGALSAIHERLLEIPLVLFAIAWLWLGYTMWRATAPSATATS